MTYHCGKSFQEVSLQEKSPFPKIFLTVMHAVHVQGNFQAWKRTQYPRQCYRKITGHAWQVGNLVQFRGLVETGLLHMYDTWGWSLAVSVVVSMTCFQRER